jgi:CRISPR-associated protein Csb2
MPSHFCLTIRFLNSSFHGRRDRGLPEWPPSPLRAFQSLVAAAARRRYAEAFTALKWLEQQPAPKLIAPAAVIASGYRLSVPNNSMDIVAKAWCRGNDSNSGDANPATHRTMKKVHPTLMIDCDAVHYLWTLVDPLSEQIRVQVEILCDVARSVVALGWGIDVVVGQGAILSDVQADALPGERWSPSASVTGDGLRIPNQGTLSALCHRHERFLSRISPDGFTVPPPLTNYQTVVYRRAFDPQVRPVAAFSLLKLDASGFRAFDTPRRSLTVAGMMRYITKVAAGKSGWTESKINAFILGHGGSNHAGEQVSVGLERFAYLPLPSVGARGEGKARAIGSIRRVMISSFADNCEDEIVWARRALSAQEFIDDQKRAVALLSLVPSMDKTVRYYTQPATQWATVTPVILPGYDDPAHYRRRLKQGISAEEQKKLLVHLDERIERLLRKAIVQAGFSETLADHVQIEWCKAGFWLGTDIVGRYGVPDHLRCFPRWHVKIHWLDAQKRPVEIPGPICIGGGRFYGLGLFAAL